MARNDDGVFGQRHQFRVNRAQDLLPVASRKIGAADAVAKQSVARDQFVFRGDPDGNAALSVAWRFQNLKFGVTRA